MREIHAVRGGVLWPAACILPFLAAEILAVSSNKSLAQVQAGISARQFWEDET